MSDLEALPNSITKSDEQKKFLFQILSSNSMRCGHPLQVSVRTFNEQIESRAIVRIVGMQDAGCQNDQILLEKHQTMKSSDFTLFTFDIPDERWQFGEFELHVLFQSLKSNEEIVRKSLPIRLLATFQVFLIELDKPLYRPGESVKVRVLKLVGSSLSPAYSSPKPSPIEIFLKDCTGNIVDKCMRQDFSSGVCTWNFQLGEHPTFGIWTVEVHSTLHKQKTSKTFEVLEYRLPGFEVTIEAAPKTFVHDGHVNGRVAAFHTFGEPVQGQVDVKFVLKNMPHDDDSQFWPETQPLPEYSLVSMALKNGKVDFQCDLIESMKLKPMLDKNRWPDQQFDFEIQAEVCQSKTGEKFRKNFEFSMINSRYQVRIVADGEERNFNPGLKYRVQVLVRDANDNPITYENDEDLLWLGWRFGLQKSFNEVPLKPIDGWVGHELDTPDNESQIMFRAKFRNEKFVLGYVHKKYSRNNCCVQLRLKTNNQFNAIDRKAVLNEPIKLQLSANRCLNQYQLFVMDLRAKSLIHVQHVSLAEPKKSIEISLNVRKDYSDKLAVMVLSVYEESNCKRVAADQITIKLMADFHSSLSICLSSERVLPGADVEVNVESDPETMVHLLAMDESLEIMRTGNRITKSDVLDALETISEEEPEQYSNCYSRCYSRNDIFHDLPIIYISNLENEHQLGMDMADCAMDFVPRPLFANANSSFLMKKCLIDTDRFGVQPLQPPPVKQARKNFAETWLWRSSIVNSKGKTTLQEKVPDSITTWMIGAFSTHFEHGLCILKQPKRLIVFKPFFVNMIVPVSAKRNECIKVQVQVFNYEDSDALIDITLKHRYDDDEDRKEKMTKSQMKLKQNDNECLAFWIQCDQVGWIQFDVIASGLCVDRVTKRIFVRPEGEPQFESHSHLVQLKQNEQDSSTIVFDLKFPINAIPMSKRILLSVNGDLLAKTLDNLNRLVRVPCGCGEQNMINFVPNCLIYTYLNELGKLEPEIKLKLAKNARVGYDQELRFQRIDGSFSAFGESDSSGSTWLTAFVIRSFSQAKDLLQIDTQVMRRAVDWMVQKVNKDGSYAEVGFVHDRVAMGGMITDCKDSPVKASISVALSAYVLIALHQLDASDWTENTLKMELTTQFLEDEIKRDEPMNCYTLVLVSYALHLRNSRLKDSAWNKVWSHRHQFTDTLFWSNAKPAGDDSAKSLSKRTSSNDSNALETTAYVALIMMERLKSIPDVDMQTICYKTISYLIANQTEFGAFSSTQDTVIALQALCRFASQTMYNVEPCLKLTLTDKNDAPLGILKIDKSNANVNQRLEGCEYTLNQDQHKSLDLKSLCNSSEKGQLKLRAQGVGMAIVHLTLQYNTTDQLDNDSFELKVQQAPNQTNFELLLDLRYLKSTQSNMVLIELELPSGFQADLTKMRMYQQQNVAFIQRLETQRSDQVIVYYFESLKANESMQIKAFAVEMFEVKDRKPSSIHVYDYYCNQDSVQLFYSI